MLKPNFEKADGLGNSLTLELHKYLLGTSLHHFSSIF